MITEVKEINNVLKNLGVTIKDVETIELKYKKVFKNKAFPVVKITFKKE